VSELSSGSCYYGIPPANFADPSKIKIPIQCHFGENDHSKGFSDKDSALALKKKMQEAGLDVSEFFIHDKADHAFMNEDAPAYPFNKEVAADAMAKTVAFFKKTLF
jgi:carboxymethylenebutenolidase